jgi:hypothetical protein
VAVEPLVEELVQGLSPGIHRRELAELHSPSYVKVEGLCVATKVEGAASVRTGLIAVADAVIVAAALNAHF